MSLTRVFPQRRRLFPVRHAFDQPSLFDEETGNWFDEAFRRFGMLTPWVAAQPLEYMPRIDVTENEAEFRATAELPGIDPEEVEVTLASDNLTIAGEKRQETEAKEQGYYRMERHYGAFRRVIPLPAGAIDGEKVTSNFQNGVLTVTLPKRPEAVFHTRRIPVKANAD